MVVLGDAAHSFPPELALGMNSAIQDVGVLARVIDDAADAASAGDIAMGYEHERGSGERMWTG